MKRSLAPLLLVLCVVAFIGALYVLFKLRFEVGDVYAPYSSLRSDPLGSMAFYESLQKLPGITVRRDMAATNRLPEGDNTTYLHLSSEYRQWRTMPESLVQTIERFLREGGRMVITFSQDEEIKPLRETEKKKTSSKKGDDENAPAKTLLSERWGLGFSVEKIDVKEGQTPTVIAKKHTASDSLPEELEWHNETVLKVESPWVTIYGRGANAVVAERPFGKGTLVVATDSYYFSNEALLDNPQTGFLAWLIGSSHKVVFDEAHHGVIEQSGIVSLARKYRLHMAAAVLLILAGLFVWKNSTSLIPPPRPARHENIVKGKDSAAGFTGLLRRNVKPQNLLALCVSEWSKATKAGKKYSDHQKKLIETIVAEEQARPARERDLVAAYRRIVEIVHPGQKK